ncbi:restriction endonuclease subunit S [Faecalibacterium prausnitzii]|uniref:restriction endonuclease subunit S n=1 Tax=Faecalibacterium prausnitzii TaxID=853 RepID=UPI003C30DCDB
MVLEMRKMKDSGIEWIGEIPEGWEISKVSYFYEVQLGKMLQPQKKSETDTEEKYLCAANVGKNSLSLDTLKTMWFSQTEKHQFDLREGDLLVVEGGDVASCAIIETPVRNLFFQNALHRVRPLHNESVAFLRYWLMTAKSYGYIDLICNKATIAHFSKEKFIALPIPVIPQDIQSKIVSFLDLECKQIDDLLSKSRSSIEEYKKLKQAVITQAVTKGVRGEREMKESGVEWIGEINHRFSLIKLKYICSILDQYRKPISADKRSQSGSVLYDYYGASGAIDKIDDYTIDDHVMLIGEDGANLRMRNLPLMYEVNGKAWINNHAHILKPTERVDFYYLFYALEGLDINPYITGSAQPKLSQENLQNIWVPLPSLEEQQEIATYIRSKCAEIDRLIAKKEQLVKELESYKKSLIYEVVTGKREV